MTPSRAFSTRRAAAGALLALGLAAAAPVFAQGAPLRVILPVGPGSGVDVIVRSAQNALSKALGGQPVVIENLAGAGGITGTQALVRAAPDGNTIAIVSNNHAVNPSVFKKMPYDSLADITPITVIGGSPFLLVVNPAKVPARTARELQAFLKARPDSYNYGSSGNGTIIHLAGEMFVDAAGVQVKRLHEALVAAFNDPEVKAGFAKRDDFLTLGSPEAAAQFFRSEQARYAHLVQKAGIKPE